MLIFLLVVGFLLAGILFFQPRSLFTLISQVAPGVVYFAEVDRPLIALTIDDGPDAKTTSKILEVLSRYDAKATFFLISDRISGNEALVRAMVEQGHELGNHLTDDKISARSTPKVFEAELLEAQGILSQFSQTRWLRPGGGWYNQTMVKIANRHQYQVALGSIFPFDTHIPCSEYAVQQVLINARPGAIVILHDTKDWGERTVLTLEKTLPKLLKRGYRIVTLSQLFEF
jgi:peptidoglycan/xylan/chitin deacetylase (PgdA/CDA1 family)